MITIILESLFDYTITMPETLVNLLPLHYFLSLLRDSQDCGRRRTSKQRRGPTFTTSIVSAWFRSKIFAQPLLLMRQRAASRNTEGLSQGESARTWGTSRRRTVFRLSDERIESTKPLRNKPAKAARTGRKAIAALSRNADMSTCSVLPRSVALCRTVSVRTQKGVEHVAHGLGALVF